LTSGNILLFLSPQRRTERYAHATRTLDNDFDVYRRYRNQPFERVFLPED